MTAMITDKGHHLINENPIAKDAYAKQNNNNNNKVSNLWILKGVLKNP